MPRLHVDIFYIQRVRKDAEFRRELALETLADMRKRAHAHGKISFKQLHEKPRVRIMQWGMFQRHILRIGNFYVSGLTWRSLEVSLALRRVRRITGTVTEKHWL